MPLCSLYPFTYGWERVASLLHVFLRHAEYEWIADGSSCEHDAIKAVSIDQLSRIFRREDIS